MKSIIESRAKCGTGATLPGPKAAVAPFCPSQLFRLLPKSTTVQPAFFKRDKQKAIKFSAVLLFTTGCSRAPSFNILGSFFPSWILCGLIGILLTACLRFLFVRTKWEQELSPLILVYPCLAALFTFTLWLLFFD